MLKQVFSTTVVRLSIAVMGLLVTTLNARVLGAEGLGEIRIFTVTVTLLVIVANFVGGPHLIFRSTRHSLSGLLLRSYAWCIAVSVLFFCVQYVPGLAFKHHDVIALSTMFYALGWVHVYCLIGFERITLQNLVVFSFNGLLLVGVWMSYYVLGWSEPIYFVIIYAVAAISQWLLGGAMLFVNRKRAIVKPPEQLTKVLLKDGVYVQSGNLFQQLNYRLGDYILEATWGKAAVGIYGLAIQLAEGIWTVARSASLVQYARLSNMANKERAKKITFQFAKAVVIVSVFGFLVLSFLPKSFYALLFGEELVAVRGILRWLLPALSLYSAGFIYSHYFSSQGQFKINTLVSFIGLIVILLTAPLFIPRFGIPGAIAAHSATYLASLLGFIVMLKRQPSRAHRWLWPSRKDLRWLRRITTGSHT